MATRNRVSREDFIRAVFAAKNGGQTYIDVANQLGLSESTVRARITKYRNSDSPCPLPTLGERRHDSQADMALIAELSGKTVEQVQADADKLAQAKAKRDEKRSQAEAKTEKVKA